MSISVSTKAIESAQYACRRTLSCSGRLSPFKAANT